MVARSRLMAALEVRAIPSDPLDASPVVSLAASAGVVTLAARSITARDLATARLRTVILSPWVV
jgi:hypothetical protein